MTEIAQDANPPRSVLADMATDLLAVGEWERMTARTRQDLATLGRHVAQHARCGLDDTAPCAGTARVTPVGCTYVAYGVALMAEGAANEGLIA